ncbi:MAG: hypothetical protein AUG51_17005 [Acidobacteria bacterium 13_1_20CM_3_53_8]|nr:MAG: hypothetical protein AUG51_17005 [Acidobacteria bacterium 13_1_20CM_3_53_8]
MNENPHGWKTYLAAAAAITAGAVAIANGDYVHGGQGIIGGLALIGIRGGLARLIQAVQNS